MTSKKDNNPSFLKSINEQFSHSGLHFGFYHSEDLRTGEFPPASMYLFLDVNPTNGELYSLLKREILQKGLALIHYLPEIPPDESIHAKLMNTKIEFHETEIQSLMPFSYAGEYIGENFQLDWLSEQNTQLAFGSEEFDSLVKSNNENQFSAGVHFDGEEGAYILLTQPITDPRLFLEIRELLEINALKYSTENDLKHFVLVRGNSILIYGAGADKIKFDFPAPKTINDLFDPTIGWVDAYSVELDIEEGQIVWLTVQ